jgi:Holliday junction resolvasome RuvABC endonuclease subunit
MNHNPAQLRRILAIDLTTGGFGFAVLEGPMTLIDWGGKDARTNKNAQSVRLIENLINHYQPDALVVEDFAGQGLRRGPRVHGLIRRIKALAAKKKIKVHRFSRAMVRVAFSESGAYTKHQIAESIASRFPELAPRLPPFRKCTMNEDYRMNFFDAAALALTYFYSEV